MYCRDANDNNKQTNLTSDTGLKMLRAHLRKHNFKTSGITDLKIGLHLTIQCTAAMQMYLAGVPPVTIMLMGRWSSNAILLYLRRQVIEFSENVAETMTQKNKIHQIPDAGSFLNDRARREVRCNDTENWEMVYSRDSPVYRDGVFNVWGSIPSV